MRKLTEIICHCADTGVHQNFDVEDVRKWHVEERNFSDCGYHFYIRLDGELQVGRDIKKSGAHAKGHNKSTVGVCFEGGKLEDGSPWDRPMDQQIVTYKRLQEYLFKEYNTMEVSGHYKYSSKTCPNFPVEILNEE